jgi:Tfp pilus assembly major pilin PilA
MMRDLLIGVSLLALLAPVLAHDKLLSIFMFYASPCGHQVFGAGVTSYSNTGGTGSRTSIITATASNLLTNNGAVTSELDGNFTASSSFSHDFRSGAQGSYIQYDFGAGQFRVIDEIKWYQDVASTHSTWVLEASQDALFWDELKSSFTLGGSIGAQVISFTNSSGYRYYRLRQTYDNAGASSTPWNEEIEFKILSVGSGATVDTTRQSYGQKGGSGNRSAIITVTSTATFGNGDVTKLIEGSSCHTISDSALGGACSFTNGLSSKEIKFDFGASYSPKITEFTWFQSNTSTHGTWKIAGSTNDTTYTDLATGLTLGGAIRTTYAVTNTTAYRYYKLIQTGGTTSSSPWLREIWFKLGT